MEWCWRPRELRERPLSSYCLVTDGSRQLRTLPRLTPSQSDKTPACACQSPPVTSQPLDFLWAGSRSSSPPSQRHLGPQPAQLNGHESRGCSVEACKHRASPEEREVPSLLWPV